jgi:SPP1 gp7 family putative phage head morphogenesis protein
MRKLTRDDDIFAIRDKIVKVYLKMILRRFKRLNQGTILGFDEMNVLSAVNTAYEDVIALSVEALRKIAIQTYRWVCDEDFLVDMWLSGWLQEYDPVTHYKWYDEADRKRSRAYEAIMSCLTSADRKKQVEVATKAWAKQFEQTSDNLVEAVLKKAYQDHNVKYVKWYTMKDKRVCTDCKSRDGKIYPITSKELHPLHYNCRCWWIPVGK